MKKTNLYFSLLLSFIGTLSFGQNYSFEKSVLQYQSLQNAQSVSNNEIWTPVTQFNLEIGFPFTFIDNTYSSLIISENLYFGNDSTLSTNIIMTSYGNLIHKLNSLSPILTKLVGNAGNRIRIIEFKNTGFVYGSEKDSTNFQTWLYEGTNIIEMHYGQSNITSTKVFKGLGPSEKGPLIGIVKDIDTSALVLSGIPSSPVANLIKESSPIDEFTGLFGYPPPNTLYRFIPKSTSSTDMIDVKKYFFYDTYLQTISLNLPILDSKEKILFYNIEGKIIKQYFLKESIDVSSFENGIYFCTFLYDGKLLTNKFFKN